MKPDLQAIPDPVCDLVGAVIPPVNASDETRLEGVDWSIHQGDFWVLAAWAGSGKRDFLATIAGMQKPVAGRCFVMGRDLYRLDAAGLLELRRRIGLVYEEGGRLFNNLSVVENIALPVAYHTNRSLKDVLPEIEPLLACLDLTSIAELLPTQLDRSWCQRAALARALALKPPLLLLTNPLMGMDVRHVRWWMEFLRQLNSGHAWLGHQPLTLIVTSDDWRPWVGQARQFAIIRNRRVLTFRNQQELAAAESILLPLQELAIP